MSKTITDFIRTNQIDSFQKLYFLLFLEQHSEMKGTLQDFTERLYFGDTLLLEEIITDLQKTELLQETEYGWQLSDNPEIRAGLEHLARAFEDPLARQDLLEQVKRGMFVDRYRGIAQYIRQVHTFNNSEYGEQLMNKKPIATVRSHAQER